MDEEILNTIKIIHAYQTVRYLMEVDKIHRHQAFEPHGSPITYDLTNDEKKAFRTSTSLTEAQLQEMYIIIHRRCKINSEMFTSELYT